MVNLSVGHCQGRVIYYEHVFNPRYIMLEHLNGQNMPCSYCLIQPLTNVMLILHGNIDQILLNSLYGLLNYETVGLYSRVIITEHIFRVQCKHM